MARAQPMVSYGPSMLVCAYTYMKICMSSCKKYTYVYKSMTEYVAKKSRELSPAKQKTSSNDIGLPGAAKRVEYVLS